eukprot:TRINITY_DN4593_c0_g1_i1.p1 TRINITY_DN4593_c0_g1~~TRINITY_DN4593_c0_g1_i1.p1  ORF type:complete len:598 (-),score=53.78 TRINITY_DN4593_c0_g1_i1:20-1813(-)
MPSLEVRRPKSRARSHTPSDSRSGNPSASETEEQASSLGSPRNHSKQPARDPQRRIQIQEPKRVTSTSTKAKAPANSSKKTSASSKPASAPKLPDGFSLPSADEIRRRHTSTYALKPAPLLEMAVMPGRSSEATGRMPRLSPRRESPPSDQEADGGFRRGLRGHNRVEDEDDNSRSHDEQGRRDQPRRQRDSQRSDSRDSDQGALARRPSRAKPLAYLHRHGAAGGGASSMQERIQRRQSLANAARGESSPGVDSGDELNPFSTKGRRQERISAVTKSVPVQRSTSPVFGETEAQIEEYRRAFNMFDEDGDGTLTISELHNVFTTLGQEVSDQELQRMVAEIDENGDGEIDFNEFLSLMRGKSGSQAGSKLGSGLLSKLRTGFKKAAAKKLAEAVEAANLAKNPIEGMENFRGVQGREAVDYALRTRQQHLISHYHMADNKANMLITVGAIALSYTVSQIIDQKASYTLMNFSFWALVALLFAVYSVLPKYSSKAKVSSENQRVHNFNILFYEDFAQIPYETFMENMVELLDDDEILYAALSRDIYLMGSHLHQQKYKFLRWSYLTFAFGILLSAVIFVVTNATGWELSQDSSVQGG